MTKYSLDVLNMLLSNPNIILRCVTQFGRVEHYNITFVCPTTSKSHLLIVVPDSKSKTVKVHKSMASYKEIANHMLGKMTMHDFQIMLR